MCDSNIVFVKPMHNLISSVKTESLKLISWLFLFKNVYWLKFKYRICLSVLQTPYKPARSRWVCVLWINKNRRLNRTWYATVDFIFQMINDSALILFSFKIVVLRWYHPYIHVEKTQFDLYITVYTSVPVHRFNHQFLWITEPGPQCHTHTLH